MYRVLLFVMFLLSAAPVRAAEDYTTVVNVDVSDVNAAAAKEKAMAQANREALNRAAPLFASADGIALLNSLNNDQILYFIKEATVLSEKSSDVRYIASLQITIQDSVLRQYLSEKGVTEDLPQGTADVLYVFPTLSDWLTAERQIKALKSVEQIETVAMTRRKVQFRIVYSGNFDDLRQEMRGIDLSLRQNENIYVMDKIQSFAAGE